MLTEGDPDRMAEFRRELEADAEIETTAEVVETRSSPADEC